MSLGQNIRLHREMLGLSQEELAKKLGYKDRSTIAKIESDVNDLTQSKIVAIAKALQTTPAVLMGWDNSSVDVSTSIRTPAKTTSLSPEDEELLRKFHCLDARGKSAVLNVLNHEYESLPGEKARSSPKEA